MGVPAASLRLPLVLQGGLQVCVPRRWQRRYSHPPHTSCLFWNRSLQVVEGGTVFFRESCFRQSGDKARKNNPTHYR